MDASSELVWKHFARDHPSKISFREIYCNRTNRGQVFTQPVYHWTLYPLKTLKNQSFYAFKGYRKRPVV